MPSITGLATTSALTSVENKIPSISNLVKKSDCNTKITEIEKKLTNHKHDKYITTPEFNKLAANIFNARLIEANFVAKANFDNKLSDLNRKVVSNKTKDAAIKNELTYFHDKNLFDEDDNPNYYILQSISKYLKVAYVNDSSMK